MTIEVIHSFQRRRVFERASSSRKANKESQKLLPFVRIASKLRRYTPAFLSGVAESPISLDLI